MLINKATLPLAWALRQVGKRVRLRGWDRLLRALFHPDRQRHFAFQIPFNGFTYLAYADNFIDWNVLFYGSYEKFELRLLAALADRIEGAVFLDVGTNVGHHALYMAGHAEHIHAFEPNPALWPLIKEKITVNGVQNIILHQCGLGATSGKSPLYLGPESGGSSLIPGVNGICSSNSVPVTIVRGDDFFRETGINKLDLIKLYIEGFEKHAIAGMSRHIDKWRPIIMIEISETGKEQFGDFPTFSKTFPANYEFYFCHWLSGVIIRMELRPANKTVYSRFSGNVFCIPHEKRELFLEVADIS
jgi:FkbM family methyltransferase